jgi:hypothetical protein
MRPQLLTHLLRMACHHGLDRFALLAPSGAKVDNHLHTRQS